MDRNIAVAILLCLLVVFGLGVAPVYNDATGDSKERVYLCDMK